jgi:Kef-type K+ transport system membrane component KefB
VEPVQLAALFVGLALVASMVSVELGVTVALLELSLGIVVGNVADVSSQEWLDLLAAFASIVLTFLAGMEVDPAYMRRRLGASLGIGVVSFVGPFVVAAAVAFFVLDWSGRASLIAGTALSTTSLAVVYAVLVERGLTGSEVGGHRHDAVLVARHRRRAVGDRADRDRGALVPSRGGEAQQAPRVSEERGVRLEPVRFTACRT